jgi:hypothetical protein
VDRGDRDAQQAVVTARVAADEHLRAARGALAEPGGPKRTPRLGWHSGPPATGFFCRLPSTNTIHAIPLFHSGDN